MINNPKAASEMTDVELRRAFFYFDELRMEGAKLTPTEDARWVEIDREYRRRGGV